ncbi:MAG: hypothetical protein LLF94_09455 [Chlamydiales bacterium]|nr:hypothetical protein [Chlamydiales bacterium]
MSCPVCPTVGILGGILGGYIGVNPPANKTHRVLSAFIASTAVLVTVVALRHFTGLTLCDGLGNFSARNIAQVMSIGLVLGVIYSIGINALYNRFIAAPTDAPPSPPPTVPPHSCCKNK